MKVEKNKRILVVDDEWSIHDDYRKILAPRPSAAANELSAVATALFDDAPAESSPRVGFDVDCAHQGQQGFKLAERAWQEGRPYALAFVDIRMPPGWDGIETVRRIWSVDPQLLIVLCSAYSDYSWEDLVKQLGETDRLLIVKKPFDNIEIRQAAMAMTKRWNQERLDFVTGLPGRRALTTEARRAWSQSLEQNAPLTCALLDVDQFAALNADRGNEVGDAMLRQIGAALAESEEGAAAFRYGNDEFCLLFSEPQLAVQSWGQRVRQRIAAGSWGPADAPVHLTISVGVAERTTRTRNVGELIGHAEQALRAAKRSNDGLMVFGSVGQIPGGVDQEAELLGRVAEMRRGLGLFLEAEGPDHSSKSDTQAGAGCTSQEKHAQGPLEGDRENVP